MRSYKTEGIIIKRRNFGEADRILTVFTKDLGKIQVKAIGVRRINSRRSAHIELLNVSMLSLYKGRSLHLVTEAHAVQNFSNIKADLSRVGFAYHICELIDGLCAEGQENPAIFALLHRTLLRLEEGIEEISVIIHEFEVRLLSILGFWSKTPADTLDTSVFIEGILERRLKSRRILPRFS